MSSFARETLARAVRRSARSGRPLRRHMRDRAGRAVEIGELQPQDWEGVLAMYRSLELKQRAQGLPPLTEERRAVWVDELWRGGPNVIARADGRIIGHAALVLFRVTSFELVVFVHQEYQGAGIGGALVDAVLSLARRRGAELVCLSVERRNSRAIGLYRRMGFRPVSVGQSATQSGEEIWTLPLSAAQRRSVRQPSRFSIGNGMSGIHVRLSGLGAALRFARLPVMCAALIAIASEDPRGRVLATVIALMAVGLGVVVHARQIVLGRRDERFSTAAASRARAA